MGLFSSKNLIATAKIKFYGEDKADDLESRIDALGTVPKGGAVPSLIY